MVHGLFHGSIGNYCVSEPQVKQTNKHVSKLMQKPQKDFRPIVPRSKQKYRLKICPEDVASIHDSMPQTQRAIGTVGITVRASI